MKRLLLFLLLLAPIAQAQTWAPLPVDLVMSMNTSTPGTTLTTAIANAGTVSNNCVPGGAGTTGCGYNSIASGLTVGANQNACSNLGPVSINGGGPTFPAQSLNYNNVSHTAASFQTPSNFYFNSGIQPTKFTIAGCFTLGMTPEINGNDYDMVWPQDAAAGNGPIIQIANFCGASAGTQGVRIEVPHPAVIHSACILLIPLQTYWFSLNVNNSTNIATLTVRTPQGALIGQVTVACTSGPVHNVLLSSNETGNVGGPTFYQNLMMAWTGTPPVELFWTQTDPWAGVLAPGRGIAWTPGVTGGIPSGSWSTCVTSACNTLQSSVTAANIVAAVNSASGGSGSVVTIPAGTFSLGQVNITTPPVNVALRGAGANLTKLNFTSGDPGIKAAGATAGAAVIVTPISGRSGGIIEGQNTVSLATVSGLKVGNQIIFDQLASTTDAGGLLVLGTGSGYMGPFTAPGNAGPYATAGISEGFRGPCSTTPTGCFLQNQIVTVASCNGVSTPGTTCTGTNVAVGFNPPIHMVNWSTASSMSARWSNTPASYFGVEDLTTDMTNDTGADSIDFSYCANCWIKGVASVDSSGDSGSPGHFNFSWTVNNSVVNNYMFLTQLHITSSYGVNCAGDSNLLVENNIFHAVASPVITNGTCNGMVVGYNFGTNNYYTQNTQFNQNFFGEHAGGIDTNLIEGNIENYIDGDNIHGTGNLTTAFRNYLLGPNPACWASGATYPASTYGICGQQPQNNTFATSPVRYDSYHRFENIIGNVLGTSGVNTNYNNNTGSVASIYYLGNGNTIPNDPNVVATAMLWANADSATGFGAPRFNCNEVAAGTAFVSFPVSQAVLFNPCPVSHTIPPSFYYTSKPSWWPAGKAWPLIGPDITGGNAILCTSGTFVRGIATSASQCSGGTTSTLAGGRVNSNPAMDCYLTLGGVPTGTGPQLTNFNENTCYASVPVPPTVTVPIISPAQVWTDYNSGDSTSSGAAILNITAGTPPYTCSITSGSLPPGMTLSELAPVGGAGGVDPGGLCILTGTPTVSGDYPLTVQATDSLSLSASANVTFEVLNVLQWNAATNYNNITNVVWSGNYYKSTGFGANHQPDLSPTFWSVLGPAPNFSPTITAITEVVVAAHPDQETITWTTDIPATSQIGYTSADPNYLYMSPESDLGGVTSHSVTIGTGNYLRFGNLVTTGNSTIRTGGANFAYAVISRGLISGTPSTSLRSETPNANGGFSSGQPLTTGTFTMVLNGGGPHNIAPGFPMYVALYPSVISGASASYAIHYTITSSPALSTSFLQVHWPDYQDFGFSNCGVSTVNVTNDTLTCGGNGAGSNGAAQQFEILTNVGGTTPSAPYTITVTAQGFIGGSPVGSPAVLSWPMTIAPVSFAAGTPSSYPTIPLLSTAVTGRIWSWESNFVGYAGYPCTGTSVQVVTNSVTVQCNNSFLPVPGSYALPGGIPSGAFNQVGTQLDFSGFTGATFLNGLISQGPTAISPTQFSFGLTHANYGPTADSGTVNGPFYDGLLLSGGPCSGGWNSPNPQQCAVYYDGEKVFETIQAYDFTHNLTPNPLLWSVPANHNYDLYHGLIISQLPPGTGEPGYWVHPHGLYYHYVVDGVANAQSDLSAQANVAHGASMLANGAPYADANLIREACYMLGAKRIAFDAGIPITIAGGNALLQIKAIAANCVGEMDQIVNQTGTFDEPPLSALGIQSLIDYYEDTTIQQALCNAGYFPGLSGGQCVGNDLDVRVPPAVQKLADYMWATEWVPWNGTNGTFIYNTGGQTSGTTGSRDLQPLNLLVAPLYAWLYKHTGQSKYLIEGDQIWFAGVNSNPDSGLNGSGKNFAQQGWNSFDYVLWRTNPATLPSTSAPNLAVAGTTVTPTSSTVGAIICWGTTNTPVLQTNGLGTGCLNGTPLNPMADPNQPTRISTIAAASGQTIFAVAGASMQKDSTVTSVTVGTNPANATLTPATLAFGNQNVGTTSTASTATLTNTGTVALNVTSIATSTNFARSGGTCPTPPFSLPPTTGNTCTIGVTFSPTAVQSYNGNLTVSDNAPNSPQQTALTGQGVSPLTVSLTPSSLAFGNQNVNTTSTGLPARLTNTGSNTVTVTSASTASTFFTLTNTGTCAGTSFTLAAGAFCDFIITFTPNAIATFNGTFSVTSNALPSPATIGLSGRGTQATILWTPASYNFGNVNVGLPTDSSPLTLQNTGTGPLNVALSIAGPNLTKFAIKSQTCGPILAVGATCTAIVTFTPTAAISYTAALRETDANASNSPLDLTITGTGVTPATPVIAPHPIVIIP